MKSLSHSAFVALLDAQQGAFPIGIETITDARARKRNNPFGTIYKHARVVGFCGANYERSVNRECSRIGAYGHFETESLPWGKWLVAGKVIQKENEYFLRVQTTPGMRDRSRAKVLAYHNKNGHLSYSDIHEFLPLPTLSKKQTQAGLVSASKFSDDEYAQVWVRNYSFHSISKVRVNGETFRLIPN